MGQSPKVGVVIMALLLAVSAGQVQAGSKGKALKWMLGSVLTGVISGAAGAEIAERYKIQRALIREGKLQNGNTVHGISRAGTLVKVPPGHYKIYATDTNQFGDEFIVIENKAIDDLTAIFVGG